MRKEYKHGSTRDFTSNHTGPHILVLIQHHHIRDHARTTTGTTLFYRAVGGGSVRILHMLHDAGCDVDRKTSQCLMANYVARVSSCGPNSPHRGQ